MSKIKEIINECRSYEDEREWFEFKENVFLVDHVGEYISAISVVTLSKTLSIGQDGAINTQSKCSADDIPYSCCNISEQDMLS